MRLLFMAWLMTCVHSSWGAHPDSRDEQAGLQPQIDQYDQFTIGERLDTLVFRVNALERGIYLIQKAVLDSQEWDEEQKAAICVEAGKKVRPANINSMKAIIMSLSDETADMNLDQKSAYREYRQRVWAIHPGAPLC